jgi:DNA-binding NarL/FixJ family response regulator
VVGPGPGTDDRGMAVRVLIVDDHAPFRALARLLLAAEGFDVVGEADDGPAALAAARRLLPDVVLLDVQLREGSGGDGFGVAEALTAHEKAPTVVLVSSRSRTDYGHRVACSAAHGFIPKAELSGAELRSVLAAEKRAS